jgi:hypothetical protein
LRAAGGFVAFFDEQDGGQAGAAQFAEDACRTSSVVMSGR